MNKKIIEVARGDRPADLLLTDARIVNVYSGRIVSGNIAICDGIIAGTGDYAAKETIDLKGAYVAPGLIDAHVHIESTMVTPERFGQVVLPFGTTGIVTDPHEIANVLGLDGIRYMIRSAQNQPANIFFTLPSCVPATGMETAGADLGAEDLNGLMDEDMVVALGEMMNFPGVIHCDPQVLAKLETAKKYGLRMDGHSPGLTGRMLNAYLASGISSDHECTTAEEAAEKLDAGVYIMVRQGTGAKNLDSLIPVINEKTSLRMMWCTDDRHLNDIIDTGHINTMVAGAVQAGLDPMIAIRMATLNPAQYFGLRHLGAIGPGKQADLIVFNDFSTMTIEKVFLKGSLIAENGSMLTRPHPTRTPDIPAAMNIDPAKIDFSIPARGRRIRIIEVVGNQIITRCLTADARISGDHVLSDVRQDILKIAVVERYTGKTGMGKGFVKGFGIKSGAIASSVAHDSHNIIVVGVEDDDMHTAVNAIIEMNGGLAAVKDGHVRCRLALPIAGLMSTDDPEGILKSMNQLLDECRGMGCVLKDPFMTLSFLALPVIPDLKITDKGIFDVRQFKLVSLFDT